MSVFGNIMSKIFGGPAQAQDSSASVAPPAAAPGPAPATAQGGTASPVASESAASPATDSVDVVEVVSGLAAKSGQKLNWRQSIVDLLKVLDLDSSLTARKQLAQELHYTGDMNDTATMNVWLHKQVMRKLAENGGKVPDDLRD